MHPSGYIMAASTLTKVRLYHIMQDTFLFFGELDIKECRAMSFSNGGHLIACVDNDHLRLINCYNCQEMHSIKLKINVETEIK